jgi:hypothetical protein
MDVGNYLIPAILCRMKSFYLGKSINSTAQAGFPNRRAGDELEDTDIIEIPARSM